MRRLCLTAALILCAATAQAGDPLSAGQEIQALQSALVILGYDPGAVDGRIGPQTSAAMEAYMEATGFDAGDGELETALFNALLADTGPALAERYGTNPDGFWDIDWAASGMEPYSEGMATCETGGNWYFSGGIVWRHVESGAPIVLALVGDELEALPLPSGEFIEPNRFVSIDANTMHRFVEGSTEVWVRCGPGQEPEGGATPEPAVQ